MLPYASIVLQRYYKVTGWNEDNLYSNLTRASTSILDFSVPRGLHFHISKSPNPWFKTTYSMNALPSLNGSIGYIFTSCDLDVKGSADLRLKDVVERFRIYDVPRRPEGKPEQWLGGERRADFLLYGRYYIPSSRLDALYSTRLSAQTQALISVISDPSTALYARGSKGGTSLIGANNVMFNLQRDTGRWSTEYSWSADDGMLGARALYNFGALGDEEDTRERNVRSRRVDEEEAMEGGLRGRFSAGAEVYFSAKEKSAGVSTGLRFTTLPEPSSSDPNVYDPIQPPTALTAIFNPMMGHISSAYTARVSRDLSLCSRFDFNVYSYESEWTMGAEWWIRKRIRKSNGSDKALDVALLRLIGEASQIRGVVKARMSTSSDVSLMWEGRLGKTLVSLGVVSDFSNRSKPIRAIGLELSYFSSE
ncbi:uncharacterized protein EI90DRAFT_3146121 [Cantharellus anzutake]|uniref:uncharacterized protein n=1 Tax=Cantharellus anzutake TaxID=1750568 RepID=UPI001903A8AB|nr:uncharacterized protein EI90DRAFT_3146121 [Cantharellus anzutake]KAF8328553.1 hypothetical protein EI90DRAFT_3146121 [Cantharellus anzutake]